MGDGWDELWVGALCIFTDELIIIRQQPTRWIIINMNNTLDAFTNTSKIVALPSLYKECLNLN